MWRKFAAKGFGSKEEFEVCFIAFFFFGGEMGWADEE